MTIKLQNENYRKDTNKCNFAKKPSQLLEEIE